MMWNNWTFYNPDFLYALALVPLLWIWYYFRQREQAAQLQISSLKGITQNSWKAKGRHLIFLFRTIALAILNCCICPTTIDLILGRYDHRRY